LQNALSAEHSFRAAVIERAAEGICVFHAVPTHPFVKFTVWNQRMVDITGHTMDEINRVGWFQTVYPDPAVRQRAIERMESMRKGDDLRHERWEITSRDGSERVLHISTSRLISTDGLEHVLALMDDFTKEEHLQREAKLGRIDVLTGVKSLRAFREECSILLRLAFRTGAPTALGFLDLDDLKVINDRMGHAEGDRVLETFGRMLAESTRSTDVVGRLGGDEFAVLLPDTDATSAKFFFDRLHKRLLEAMQAHGWQVGLSMGVAFFPVAIPNDGAAIRYADNLMYRAKRTGKNHVVYEEFPAPEVGERQPLP